jgi:recombinational DNA repair protein (RecF pathway)
LARQARTLARHPALVGWLYTTTRQMACRVIRSEQRRAAREQTAHTTNQLLHQPAAEPDWEHLRPALDDAMHELNHSDRVAVLLRFFKNKTLREVGLELGLTEAPAEAEVSQLVGMAVEQMALGAMDPGTPYGDNGQTVQDQLSQLNQERATLNDLNQQAEPLIESLSDQDYLTYKDRWMAFGEEAALQWVISTHGQ